MTTELEMDIAPEQGNTAMDIGQVLRSKRLALAYPERQVATELKLSIEKVYALENNDFKCFRSPTFVRGYLKSYCRLLGLDHRPILEAYDQQLSGHESTIRSVDNVKQQASVRDPIVMIVSVIIIAIVVFVAFWWPNFSNSEQTSNVDQAPTQVDQAPTQVDQAPTQVEQAPATPSASEAPEVEEEQSAAVSTDDAPTALEDLDLSALEGTDIETTEALEEEVVTGLSAETMALLEDAGLDPDEVAEAARNTSDVTEDVPPQQTKPAYTSDIVVRFDEDCWTEVRDSTGRILFSGVKSSGSTLELNGEAPYRVTLGYAPGVTEFIYKGEPFDFSSNIRNDLARFELE